MKPSDAVPPTEAPDTIRINHRLYISTVDVIERLLAAIDQDSIAKATLAQRVTALGVLSRILKQFEAASARTHSDHSDHQQEVIRIEYQDSHGRISRTPSWAGADSSEADPLPRRGLWSTLWQDGDGEDPAR